MKTQKHVNNCFTGPGSVWDSTGRFNWQFCYNKGTNRLVWLCDSTFDRIILIDRYPSQSMEVTAGAVLRTSDSRVILDRRRGPCWELFHILEIDSNHFLNFSNWLPAFKNLPYLLPGDYSRERENLGRLDISVLLSEITQVCISVWPQAANTATNPSAVRVNETQEYVTVLNWWLTVLDVCVRYTSCRWGLPLCCVLLLLLLWHVVWRGAETTQGTCM